MSRAPLFLFTVAMAGVALAEPRRPVEGPTSGRRVLAADYGTKRIALVDEAGKPVWEHKIRDIHDAQLLPNGNVLFQTSFQDVVEAGPGGKIVWKYDPKPKAGEKVEIHAFQRLPDGSTMIAESGRGRIIEVDGAGKVQKEIKLALKAPHPHRDTRLVRKTDAGTYLVAHEGDKAVREYDADGKVIWEYDAGSQLYSAIRLANGNTLIGAGDGHSVLEVSPDKKIVWALRDGDLKGVKLAWITMVDRLPNGNTIVVNCHAGPENPQILEVTPAKEVVWSFMDFKLFGNALPVALVVPDSWPFPKGK